MNPADLSPDDLQDWLADLAGQLEAADDGSPAGDRACAPIAATTDLVEAEIIARWGRAIGAL